MLNTNFFVGDACKVSSYNIGTFDGIIMSNLLCRLPNPVSCLQGLSQITNPKGVVLILTPYSWLDQFTSKENWLGGYYENNEAVYSKDVLLKVMEENGFEKIHEEQVPLIIREHQRKYQYIITEATGWRRL